MMTNLNLALFHIINELAGKNYILDTAAIFAAEYLIYVFSIYLVFLWFMRSKYRQEVLFAVYASLLGLGMNFIIALFYFHPRPFMISAGTLLIAHAPETSFPSDHATLMFAISLMLLTFRDLRRAGAILFLLSFIGGLARVYTGLHFPMDIAGSLFVALFSTGLLLFLKRYLVPINSVLIVHFGNIVNKLHKR
ncbi:MAG: undecaprenyl-diphosphatase [Candidatus Methanoperedens sp.]|nr:undecaprenyl-diphosphatase [Candidatus Methanoperedens sp.]